MLGWLSGFNLYISIMKVFITIFYLFCTIGLLAEEPALPGKRERKELSRIFGEETDFRRIQIPEDKQSLQGYLKEGDAVLEVVKEEQVIGYLLSTQAKGRFDFFDYSVIFSENLEILSMMILVYWSNHGVGVCNKNWLKQFKGYSGGKLQLGKNIDSISGATLSASSLVKDVERCYQLMVALKNTEVIH